VGALGHRWHFQSLYDIALHSIRSGQSQIRITTAPKSPVIHQPKQRNNNRQLRIQNLKLAHKKLQKDTKSFAL
jgi:uncharacterized membrane protein required for colicin V production